MLPLDNVRVLDLSARAAGPFCTMVLSDLGAEVLMVEPPADPDGWPTTGLAPNLQLDDAYNPFRRNKRSIILNLKHAEARQVFYQLVEDTDVVVEGFRPGVAKRLGVDYETLNPMNPRLVYCSISGYGQTGPYRLLPGHDVNYISFAGVLSLIGTPDGEPVIPYNIIADYAAGGLLPAVAILSALWARERLGQGQYIDMSMTDGTLYVIAATVGRYLSSGLVPTAGRSYLNGGSPDYRAYRCSDGKYLSIGCIEPKFWEGLCRALGREHLIPRPSDAERKEAVLAELNDLFQTRTRDEWFELLSDKDIAVAKVYTIDELSSDPHLKERQMLVEVPGPDGQSVTQVGVAPRLSATPGHIRWVGSPPGAYTREVLEQLGYSKSAISGLYRQGVVG